ncbi:cupin domain-containing protein [Pleurocapsales cyanobacterium LEGE 10410]|nr:cupin domain-containing protein [Pleurocapsales cyanobacterium LEGE 10410]
MNKHDLIQQLSLTEHIEGGYFSESYRSNFNVTTARVGSDRSILTSIYYLLTDDRPIDYLHKNQSDILHYFHAGSPITYFMISPAGELSKVKLGLNFALGEVAQLLVPGGCWKAAVLEAGEFGLLGESVAPGFDYRDLEIAQASYFQTSFPDLWTELAPYIHH